MLNCIVSPEAKILCKIAETKSKSQLHEWEERSGKFNKTLVKPRSLGLAKTD